MISTRNETKLHHTLKILYAERSGGATEQLIQSKICDIVSPKDGIIEIQTTSVSKLAPKVAALIETMPLKIVYPLVIQKIIKRIDENGTVGERKSPKKTTIYSIFGEITGLYPWLLHKNFTLEVLPVVVREIRVITEEPVQLLNKSRRHLKNWYKKDKELVSYDTPVVFKTAKDYLALLPFKKDVEFSVQMLQKTTVGKEAPLMIWVLTKSGMLKVTRTEGKKRFYAHNAVF